MKIIQLLKQLVCKHDYSGSLVRIFNNKDTGLFDKVVIHKTCCKCKYQIIDTFCSHSISGKNVK